MFYYGGYLTLIIFFNFNTDNGYGKSCLFNQVESLTSLNLSNLNTKNFTNRIFMFFGCGILEHLIINPISDG